MKKSLLLLSFTSSLISIGSNAAQYEAAVGMGHQYGGVLGAQLAYKTKSSKYFGAIGLFGVAAGFQTTFSENSKHVYGFTLGKQELDGEDGFIFATYDYHLNGFTNNGLMIGTGIGIIREDQAGWWADNPNHKTETSTGVTLTFGYKF